jgi:hypothetical protein
MNALQQLSVVWLGVVNLYGDGMVENRFLHRRLWIRHGIQRLASPSARIENVEQDELRPVARLLQSALEIVGPFHSRLLSFKRGAHRRSTSANLLRVPTTELWRDLSDENVWWRDGFSNYHNNRRGRKQGTLAGVPMYRPSLGILRNHWKTVAHRVSARDGSTFVLA